MLWVLSFLLLATVSCKSTKKAYEKGDYEKAVFNSIEKLRKSPDNRKAGETLASAYPALKEYLVERIQLRKMSQDQLKWEQIFLDYSSLNRAYDEIQRAPGAKRVIASPKVFNQELQEAREMASEERRELGRNELKNYDRYGDRMHAREAFAHFQKAYELMPNNRELLLDMEEARELATVWVEIRPIPMHSRSLELSNEFFENQLTEFICDYPSSPFIQFVTPESKEEGKASDQIIEMKFDDFVIGQLGVKEKILQRKKDSVQIGEIQAEEDSAALVYGSVEAEMHQFEKVVNSSGLLDFKILDAHTGAVLSQKKFAGTYVYQDFWGFFNGDKRALTEEDELYLEKSQASADPLPQDLFVAFTQPIFDQVVSYVKDYYRKY